MTVRTLDSNRRGKDKADMAISQKISHYLRNSRVSFIFTDYAEIWCAASV